MRRAGARPHSRPLAVWALGAALAVALATPAGPASAASAGPFRLFLPLVSQVPPLEPCGPAVTDPCALGGSQSWVMVCGGLGRVRDMVIPSPPSPSGPFELLAVGDGAAWLTVWPAATPGAAPMVRWQPRVGTDLTGLNALGFDLEADPRGVQGWAVGERDRIITLRAGCLRHEDGYESGTVDLAAVNGDTPYGGWIVGRAVRANGGRPREVGVWRILANPDDPAGAGWHDFQAQVTPPPLTDVALQYDQQSRVAEAWAVGTSEGQSTFLHGTLGADDVWRWGERARRQGAPRELTLRSQGAEGWAFGPGGLGGRTGLAGWYYYRNNITWEQDPRLFWPGRELVDVYSESRLTDERMSVGLSPAGTAPVIARLDLSTRTWRELAIPPPDLAPTAGDGSRALAPDGVGHNVYAWADDVWLYHEAPVTGTPPITATPAGRDEPGAWALLRRARPLVGFVPVGDGGWAVAAAGTGSDVLRYRDQAFQVAIHADRPLWALDGAGADLWAVGADGLTLRSDGGPWRVAAAQPPVTGDLLDVAALADGSAWAAGVGRDGVGRVWRWPPGGQGWIEQGATPGATPLRAIAARLDGRAWAVGDGCTVLAFSPDAAGPHVTNPCAGATTPVDLVAVAAPGPRLVWAAGGYYAYRWNGAHWAHQELGLGTGEQVADLVAAPAEDVWVAAWSARPAGRPATTVLRLEGGQWRPDTVLNVPVAELRLRDEPAGRRTIWASGAGTTVARRDYAVPPR